ncbi:hypothetical protein HMPREF9996_01326 [Aggregatibacter actinomycetemcomitans Y4]|nr:hypothetical protein HMPREF9996_01326 [Aggregatibacter actinomycetemcomitans Y4]
MLYLRKMGYLFKFRHQLLQTKKLNSARPKCGQNHTSFLI